MTFEDTIEVSLYCHICSRSHRTVQFSKSESMGVCFPTRHPFPGGIIGKEVSRDGSLTTVKYRLSIEREPFPDHEHPGESSPPGQSTRARVNYRILCPKCARITERSSQNNVTRPLAVHCKCGRLLYTEEKETPVFSWLDEHAPSPDQADASALAKREARSRDAPREEEPKTTVEFIRMIAVFIFFGVLFLICTQAPLLLADKMNPLMGLLASIAAIPLWLSLVRPMPGLVQGLICSIGIFAILIVNIICLWKVAAWFIS